MSNTMQMIETQYLESVISRFRDQKSLADKAMGQLTDEEIFYTPNENSNSIAVIIQHMHGNMVSRWTNFLTEDGEKEWRERDREFQSSDISRTELKNRWEGGWQLLFDTIGGLKPEDLQRTITIRSKPLLVIDAINRQFAHYSYHVGQIVYISKMLKDVAWKSLSIPKGESQLYNQMSRH